MDKQEQRERLLEAHAVRADTGTPGADLSGDPGLPKRAGWRPEWTVDVGHGCQLGLTTDDGCLVVLYPGPDDSWRPGKHIPKPVAERIAQLVSSGALR